MARTKVKIVDITGKTATQIEDGLENALSTGSELLQIVTINSKVFAILKKTIAS